MKIAAVFVDYLSKMGKARALHFAFAYQMIKIIYLPGSGNRGIH